MDLAIFSHKHRCVDVVFHLDIRLGLYSSPAMRLHLAPRPYVMWLDLSSGLGGCRMEASLTVNHRLEKLNADLGGGGRKKKKTRREKVTQEWLSELQGFRDSIQDRAYQELSAKRQREEEEDDEDEEDEEEEENDHGSLARPKEVLDGMKTSHKRRRVVQQVEKKSDRPTDSQEEKVFYIEVKQDLSF